MYKLKFTRLQNEILRLLCIKCADSLSQREIAECLEVSATAISKSIGDLEVAKLVKYQRHRRMNLNLVSLDRENPDVIRMKQAVNLMMVHECGLSAYLKENSEKAVIIGPYAKGEDLTELDIACQGAKSLELGRFEEMLERKIIIHKYSGQEGIML